MENKTIRDYIKEKQRENKNYFWKIFFILILIIALAIPVTYFKSDEYVNNNLLENPHANGSNGGSIALKLKYKQDKLMVTCQVINVWGRNYNFWGDNAFITADLRDKDGFTIRKIKFNYDDFSNTEGTQYNIEHAANVIVPITRKEALEIAGVNFTYPAFLFDK